MSSKKLDSALLEVRAWTVEDVANVLQQNGLGDFEEAFKKRNIDGDALLSLTEGMLVLWKCEFGLPNIRKLGTFIEDVRKEPGKYGIHIRSKGRRPAYRSSYSVPDNFIEYQNVDPNFNPLHRHSIDVTNSVTLYQNQLEGKGNGDTQPDIPVKPPVPARPSSMRRLHASSLPVPPNNNEHLKTFISYIKLPSLEEKDSYQPIESELYEIPNPDSSSEATSEPSENRRSIVSEEPYEENSSAQYESIDETNAVDSNVHTSAIESSSNASLVTPNHQLPEAPSLKIKGLPSKAPPLPDPPPLQLESKLVNSFEEKSGRVENVLKKTFGGPHQVPGTNLKQEKVTGTTELKKSTSSSTSSISTVTSIKTASGQPTSLSDQRLPPNLRPLPPTPGTSSFRPINSSNTLPIPNRKISNTRPGILQFPWYHNVDRKRGEELVYNGEDGTFLVRPSSQTQNPYTLTIWFGKRVYNIGVRHRPDGKYALGTEKQNEQSFRTVEEMVLYYQSELLVLYSGGERTGQTALKSSPKKE